MVNVLDEVAWLLNIRGADVPNCPLVTCYALVELDHPMGSNQPPSVTARLFIDRSKLNDEEIKRHLSQSHVQVSQSVRSLVTDDNLPYSLSIPLKNVLAFI